MSTANIDSAAAVSPLFRLPLELRRTIYTFVLPFASVSDKHVDYARPDHLPVGNSWKVWQPYIRRVCHREGDDIVWTRGCTALLAVSQQIHEETAAMLYGDNTFIISVKFDAIDFYFRWRTLTNLEPNRTYSFLDHFSQRNLLRVRNYVVNVTQVDEYTGMIKYNCSGQGLPAGMRVQVARLAKVMAGVEALQAVHINLLNSGFRGNRGHGGAATDSQVEKKEAQARAVLAPLSCLRGVRRVGIVGVSEQHAEDVRRRMMAPKSEEGISESN